jgi:hypothetical protein
MQPVIRPPHWPPAEDEAGPTAAVAAEPRVSAVADRAAAEAVVAAAEGAVVAVVVAAAADEADQPPVVVADRADVALPPTWA